MADIVQLYNDVDRSVGRAVRARRHARGLADADLASRLGMSLSDYRACEAGARRFGAERVLLLASRLFLRGTPLAAVGAGGSGPEHGELIADGG